MQIQDSTFTEESIDALEEVPQTWGFNYSVPDVTTLPRQPRIPPERMLKLFRYLSWKLFNHVGSYDNLLLAPRELVTGAKREHELRYI